MILKELHTKKIEIDFVLKYRWGEDVEDNGFNFEWKDWKLGGWFRKTRSVGLKHHDKVSEWSNNLITVYQVGVDLLFWRMWVEFSKPLLRMEYNSEPLELI
jgi:hypothetical protein